MVVIRYSVNLFQSTRPQGARLVYHLLPPITDCFNPRARKERDKIRKLKFGRMKFQSTRPQGARRRKITTVLWNIGFNPRARKERDLASGLRLPRISVSIHAPARSATSSLGLRRPVTQFQSTRPQGARLFQCCFTYFLTGFNPRARKERDSAVTFRTLLEWFQSTRPQGARRNGKRWDKSAISFNPRARKERDVFAHRTH